MTDTTTPAAEVQPVPHPLEITAAPIPGAKADDPALDYEKRTAEAAEKIVPAMEPLSDEAKTALADEIAARYVPPMPPPTIIEQINAMKEGKPATPNPQPSYPPPA